MRDGHSRVVCLSFMVLLQDLFHLFMNRFRIVAPALILSLSIACAGWCPAQQQTPGTTDTLREGFAHPPAEAKLRCYWWWLNGNTDEQTITRDLEQMKAKGYGGAILVDADGSNQEGNERVAEGPMFGSPEWTKLYLHALKEAARLKLEISLNIVSGWNLGGPDVKPEEASKLLTWSRVQVHGGNVRRQIALPPVRNGFYRDIAILAYRLHHGEALAGRDGSDRKAMRGLPFKTAARETGFSMPDSTPLLNDVPAVSGEQDTNFAEIQDISSKMTMNGSLNWQAPAGDWEILRIGYTDSDARVSTASGKWQGLAIDYLDHHALDAYWTRTVEPLLHAAKPYIGNSLKYLVTDSWELQGTNWTSAFREQFRKLRGYDPVLWLPVVTGRIVEDRDASTRFLNDLRRTVADLVVTEHYDVFAERARAWGLGIHPESGGPHGAPIDALETFRSAEFPQSEFWAQSTTHRTRDDERFFVKEAASAAHIYGKRIVAQEGMTSIGPQWSESLAEDLKPTFDQALTEGMNRLVWHEFTSSPESAGLPGQEYFAGTHLNPNVTWWAQADAFVAYMNRCQFMLQQGQPVADVLYFYGDQVPNFVRLKRDDPAHVLPGYDYDVTDEDALLRTIRIEDGELVTSNGIRYRVLAMPASGRMSLSALRRVAEYAQSGGVVAGPKPTSPTGRVSDTDATDFHQLAEDVWGDCTAEPHVFGKGRAFCASGTHSILERLGVAEDFQQSGSETALDFIHRRDGDTDIYFVRNGASSSVRTVVSFRVHGKEPELWDAVSGKSSTELLYEDDAAKGVTRIPLRLPAFGSVFVVFRHKAEPHVRSLAHDGVAAIPPGTGEPAEPLVARCGTAMCLNTTQQGDYSLMLSGGGSVSARVEPTPAARVLEGPWKVTFQAGRGGPDSPIVMNQLTDWSKSSDPRIRYFSGTANYEKQFEFAGVTSGERVILRLTHLYQVCTVRINGVEAGTIWAAPYQIDISRFLHSGINRIELAVTNLWPNRIIGDLQPGTTIRYTHTNIRGYTAKSPLLPSGLDGSVWLITAPEDKTQLPLTPVQ